MFLKKRDDVVSIPPPRVVDATGKYDGNDGRWSTFFINLGDDGSNRRGQNFRVLASTSSPLTMVPAEASNCDEECASSRGIEVFENGQPRGFEDDIQDGWVEAGIYRLSLPNWWSTEFPEFNATYGTMNVGLGQAAASSQILADQPIATSPEQDYFYLGSFGLGVDIVRSDRARAPFMQNYANSNNTIPSPSYAYGAGAVYSK